MSKLFVKIKNRAETWRGFILDLFFPIECQGCGKTGLWLCRDCLKKIEVKSPMRCPACKTDNDWGEYCEKCKADSFLNGVWPAADYQNLLLKNLIKILKYRFAKDISSHLSQILLIHLNNLKTRSRLLANSATPKVLRSWNDTILIPVPLHKKRERWRGFNQSREIAEHFSALCGIKTNYSDLIRIRYAKPQTKKSKIERQNDLLNSFYWKGSGLSGRNIILLDDVITTGATLNECAKTLKASGANEVWGLTIASG